MENLERLRAEAEAAQQRYQVAKSALQQEGMARLDKIQKHITDVMAEAKALAESLDMVFYYSPGYEEFLLESKENWSESSSYC